MQRQGDEVFIVVVSIGIVSDIEAHGLVGRHHGQGLIVDVAGHAPLRHPQDDLIALLFPDAGGPRQVQVAGAGIVRGKVGQGPDAQRVQGFIIALDQLMPPLQQAGIALQLL